MRVFFVTDRDPIPSNERVRSFGQHFHPIGPGYLRVGEGTPGVPAETGAMLDQPPPLESVTVYPERITGNERTERLGSTRLFKEIEGLATDAPGAPLADILLYIHGFDTTFEEALRFTGQVAFNLNLQARALAGAGLGTEPAVRAVVPVVFTWPSDGEMVPKLSYWSDRRDAKDAAAGLSRTLLKLAEYLDERFRTRLDAATGRRGGRATRVFRDALRAGTLECGIRIHLLAQSMGAYVLREGLRDLIEQQAAAEGSLPRLFDEIVLTAPDEDADAFSTPLKLARLPEIARRVTVYHNDGDLALRVSQTTKHWSRRLGQVGPAGVIGQATLFAVDVQPVIPAAPEDAIGHWYNRLNPVVQRDILLTFAGVEDERMGRAPLGRQRFRLGTGLA